MENTSSPLLQFDNLSKCYGSKQALSPLSCIVPSGHIIGLLGPNGSGKTTLIKTIAGILTPTTGSVRIFGQEPNPQTKAVVSYLPERTYFSNWMTVENILCFFADFYQDFSREKALDMLDRLKIDRKMKFSAMSKGTKEKLQLIMVMSRNAKLYLLDEPIAGVDPATRDYILETILSAYNPEATMIFSTHLIADVEHILTDVMLIKDGSLIYAGPADQLREREGKSVDAYFREVFKC